MSLVEPPNPDPDDMWAAIVDRLEDVEDDGVEDNGPDYSILTLEELHELRIDIKTKMENLDDNILNPYTEEGRALHSEYVALTFLIKGYKDRRDDI